MTYIPDVWTARNDGSGSGLDADKLDNIDSTAFLQDITGESLADLSNVTDASSAAGWFLRTTGSGVWVAQLGIVEADITDLQSYLLNINGESIHDLSDVGATNGIVGSILSWGGGSFVMDTLANLGISVAGHTHVAANITDFDTEVDNQIAAAALEDIGDVTAYSSIAANEILQWSGSAWVHQTLAEAGIQAAGQVADLTITPKSSAYTLILTDDVVTGDATGGTFTLTLPTAVGNDGKLYHIKKIDVSTNVVTIDGASAETIDGSATVTLDVQYHSMTIVSDGTNWLVI